MKRITRRMQELGQRAEQLQGIVNQMPGRVEGLRQSVASAAEKLKQVRSDLTLSADKLRGIAETDAVGLLEDIGEVGELLKSSGFEMDGVDWDISLSRKLQVHIDPVKPTTVRALRALLAKHDDKPAANMILTALIQAQEAAEGVEVGRLVWTDVLIEISNVTSVRIGWRELVDDEEDEPITPTLPPPLPSAGSVLTSSPSYTAGSFYRTKPPEAPAPIAAPAPAPAVLPQPTVKPLPVAPTPTVRIAPTPAPSRSRERGDPMSLDRFKKMPDLGRRGA